ncbi:hypothetical protein O181_069205 [Austropuccinia psidii MF-1]|uniref:Uncharacterized protein n=1 Tax=Austropuccinia psidii MF-1 TaxID=1389203 RepID=A0A9Q3F2I4_9BASI|nr:hypothetical protein [Austropuccinia psidii MF-1]
MPQTLGNSTEFHEQTASAPESGSQISDMVSSHELGIKVESLAHESNPDPPVLPECEHRFILNIFSLSKPDTFVIAFISAQPPSSQKPNFKSYEKEKAVEPCTPIEDSGQDDEFSVGRLKVYPRNNLSQKLLKKSQGSKKLKMIVKFLIMCIEKLAVAMSLLKMDLNHKSITN